MPPKPASGSREAVKVAVRLRPMSSKEREKNYPNIIEIDKQNAMVYIQNPAGEKLNFTFDFAFPDNISQDEVYETIAAPIVSGVLEGFNGTIFAYGQTGTGKTFTMDGKGRTPDGVDLRGIMPRAFDHIFEYISAHQDEQQFLVTCTYVEIYNNELRDLLATNHDVTLKIREDPTHGVQIKGVCTHKVATLEDLNKLLDFGKKNRVVRKTNMNDESSRSHSILTIVIETLKQIEGGQHVRSGRLNLVDLAGSERAAKTGAEGIGFQEGVNINYELMILGNCIAALTSRNQTHIPYRDSKLTMLLRDSLGGNARTVMIAAIGPADYNFSETMSTLRYAERAKKIENKPKVNMDPKDALLLKYQEELAQLKAQLEGGKTLGDQVGASEEVIEQMKLRLEQQRKELAEASHMAKEERAQLEKKLEERKKEIEEEQNRQNQYSQRLAELGKYLAHGNAELMTKTKKNEEQIQKIKEKLKQREERANALEIEVNRRREKRQEIVDQCASVQTQVEQISSQLKNLISQYKNLKLKLPEVQKTIQQDREQIARTIDGLNKQLEFYQLIVDNFVPQMEVDRIKKEAIFDENTREWKMAEFDKKAMATKVVNFERPKSVTGAPHPTANYSPPTCTSGVRKSGKLDDFVIQMAPPPVKSRLRPGPSDVQIDGLDDMIEDAMGNDDANFLIDIPTNVRNGGKINVRIL